MKNKQLGFTIIELLITVAVLAVLMTMLLMAFRGQINKAKDMERKADLERLRIAFNDYYNDDQCYPVDTILDNCGGQELVPYLGEIPCDPVYKLPYCYIADGSSCSQSFKLLAPLTNSFDPIIKKLFCDTGIYCGYEPECDALINPPAGSDYTGFNYGVTSGNVQLANPDATPAPSTTPSPSPSATPGGFACSAGNVGGGIPGSCNSYADPEGAGCPDSWEASDCNSECTLDPTNWCLE